MKAFFNTTIYAEPPKHNFAIGVAWFSGSDNLSLQINVDRERLVHVEMIRRTNTKANVAFEVPRPELVTFLVRSVLREVFHCLHDEVGLVNGIRHSLWVDGPMEMTIQCR
jgi:hypothetical protein